MKKVSKSEVKEVIDGFLSSITKSPKSAKIKINSITKDPESEFQKLFGIAKSETGKLDPKLLASFLEALIAASKASAAVAEIHKIIKGDEAKKKAIGELFPQQTEIEAISEIAVVSMASTHTKVPKSCIDAIITLGLRNMEYMAAVAELAACIGENGSDMGPGELIPDICSWKETVVKQAAANLRAAMQDVKQNCAFGF